MQPLSLEEERELQRELSQGESVQWTGRPSRPVVFHSADWFAIPFSIFWVGFTAFWEHGAKTRGNLFFDLWGIPFIAIGQYMLWGRFVYSWWKKGRVLYVITQQRAFTLVTPPRAKVISADLESISSVEKETRSDGIGTLNLGAGDLKYGRRGQTTPDDLYLSRGNPVFVDINGVDEVFALLKKLQAAARDRRYATSAIGQ